MSNSRGNLPQLASIHREQISARKFTRNCWPGSAKIFLPSRSILATENGRELKASRANLDIGRGGLHSTSSVRQLTARVPLLMVWTITSSIAPKEREKR